ncbi:MAG: right-handed parallel beta-helix repeat-containing protein [bacterium]|nr:right-handed parallel beta-helix repeat-containing protein [bacterium]
MSKTILHDLLSNGGAAGFHENDCYITIDSSEFTSCHGGVGGIALYGGWGTVTGNSFHENSTPWNGFCNDLSANDFTGEIRGCWFHDTHALWPSVHLGRIYGAVTFIGNVLEHNSTSDITGTLIVNGDNDYTISHNIFRDNRNVGGGAVYAFAYATAIVELNSFVGNSSDDPTRGSVLESMNHGAPHFRDNIIAGNIGNCVSARPEYPIILDARNNWWGHASGPYHAELNPLGQGDTLVGDSVLFEPWLTSPPDTTQPSAIHPEPERPVAGTWDLQSVFPNPFNNSFTLSLAGLRDARLRLRCSIFWAAESQRSIPVRRWADCSRSPYHRNFRAASTSLPHTMTSSASPSKSCC